MKKEINGSRLTLSPMPVEELRRKVAELTDPALKKAYGEMLDGAEQHANAAIWYLPWKIFLSSTEEFVGEIGFKGYPDASYEAEIGYGIEPEYQGNGYASEAVAALCKWAFSQRDCYFIRAETAPGAYASQRVLTKNGFYCIGAGKEGPLYELERPKINWTTTFLCIGLALGVGFGAALDNLPFCISGGMVMGMLIGGLFEQRDRSHRKSRLKNFTDEQ